MGNGRKHPKTANRSGGCDRSAPTPCPSGPVGLDRHRRTGSVGGVPVTVTARDRPGQGHAAVLGGGAELRRRARWATARSSSSARTASCCGPGARRRCSRSRRAGTRAAACSRCASRTGARSPRRSSPASRPAYGSTTVARCAAGWSPAPGGGALRAPRSAGEAARAWRGRARRRRRPGDADVARLAGGAGARARRRGARPAPLPHDAHHRRRRGVGRARLGRPRGRDRRRRAAARDRARAALRASRRATPTTATATSTLKALAELRGRRRVHFGVWCDVVAAGPVRRGDPVTVAATAS